MSLSGLMMNETKDIIETVPDDVIESDLEKVIDSSSNILIWIVDETSES